MIDTCLKDIWQRQSDRGPLCEFVFFDDRGLTKIDGDQRVAAYQPNAPATIVVPNQNVSDIDPAGD